MPAHLSKRHLLRVSLILCVFLLFRERGKSHSFNRKHISVLSRRPHVGLGGYDVTPITLYPSLLFTFIRLI